MKVAIYARVSTLNKGQDVDMQLNELRAYCQQKGWAIAHEYTDKGISGSKSSRPQLDKLMTAASRHEFDAVLVWKLDRFGRSLLHLTNAIAALESYGVAFVSARDNIDLTTASGRLLFGLLASMAEFERSLIAERVKAGMANARSKGKQIGRPSLDIDSKQITSLKASGASWQDVSDSLGASISTCQRAYESTVENRAL